MPASFFGRTVFCRQRFRRKTTWARRPLCELERAGLFGRHCAYQHSIAAVGSSRVGQNFKSLLFREGFSLRE
jgi:hypothetical protein